MAPPTAHDGGPGRRSDGLEAFIQEAPLEREPIVEFLRGAAESLPAGSRVADVGAGAAPYRELFAGMEYLTIDREQSLHGRPASFDIVASADAIPLDDRSLDAIVCTQVIEHLAEPLAALKEFRRLLRANGRLFLTAPFAWEEHETPYDFYRFARSGLEHLLRRAGFEQIEIASRGNAFATIAQLLNSARWSLSDGATVAVRSELLADRLDAIAEELLSYSELDVRRSLPLGFQAQATAPASAEPADPAANAAERAGEPGLGRRTPILYIAPWVDLGGSDKGTIDWFRMIDRTRWAPSLITTQPSANRWLRQVEPYAEEVWALPELLAGGEFPSFILGFIETRSVEVVHVMNSRLAFDMLPDVRCLPTPPVIVVQHHAEEADRSGYVRYVASRYGNLVDSFSVTSRQLAEAMADYDVAASRIEVITTGIDAAEEFDPAEVTPLELGARDGPRILWPGRFVDQKDPLLTLEIVARLRDRGHRFTVEMVGEGELEETLRRRAGELGVEDHLRWHPPSQEMPRWYRSCDLLLMTSVFEGVPYVIYEALAMEMPVVAPALPGNVELLEGGGGILIDPRDDVDAYVDALERLLTDATARMEMGRAGRRRMLAECSLGEMIERHEALYSRLLAHRRDDSPGGTAAIPASPPPAPVRFPRQPAPERSICVIVPCYQHGRFLPQAIDSIRRQTLPPARVIVVDDASDDAETTAALNRLESDPLVRVIRLPENSGPSVARNRALAELEENYVLPLDADDMLVPGALESMVAQLERAPDSIGFVYPNVQHFGNRNDYYTAPQYNLDALLDNNYCAAATLFDARVFQAGVRYPEDMVYGHEDWDVVLQMAARGIQGEPAEGPCLLYRKQGFSRVNTADYGPESFHERIQARHPELFSRRNEIKAEWAPALSLLLVDGFDGTGQRWPEGFSAQLDPQSCGDFEVIDVPAAVDRVPGEKADELPARIQAAVGAARGRFVVIAGASAAHAVARPTFVEAIIRLLWFNKPRRWLLANVPGAPVPRLGLIADPVRAGAEPCAVAWMRELDPDDDTIELGARPSPVLDFAMDWQVRSPLGWRAA